ncbi:hypothetical protein E3C22_05015 [Jiella endophytica]|uniref:Uncharacterized protein n=1 Tax=Jiella endophytica TaxID=2558362 RepID=A0A4Y8RUA4_9HYPH|nr:hypothetical protein E3C22_05015 [Jiella endophytica]
MEPPSVLPDISPSRGEIDLVLPDLPSSSTPGNAQESTLMAQRLQTPRGRGSGGPAAKRPISPLEGEMAGKPEGGEMLGGAAP